MMGDALMRDVVARVECVASESHLGLIHDTVSWIYIISFRGV